MLTRAYPNAKEVEKLPLTIEITLSISEWRQVREMLKDEWPAWDVRRAIRDTIDNVEKSLSAYEYTEKPRAAATPN